MFGIWVLDSRLLSDCEKAIVKAERGTTPHNAIGKSLKPFFELLLACLGQLDNDTGGVEGYEKSVVEVGGPFVERLHRW